MVQSTCTCYVILGKDPGSIPCTDIMAHNHLPSAAPVPGHPMPTSDLYEHQGFMWCIYIHAGKTLMHTKINLNLKLNLGMTMHTDNFSSVGSG